MLLRLTGLSFVLSASLVSAGIVQAQEAVSQVPSLSVQDDGAILNAPVDGTDVLPPGALQSFQAPVPTASGHISVRLAAQLTPDGKEIPNGVTWRIFGPNPGADGKLPLIDSKTGGVGEFQLAPGSYLVHAAYGRAGATKRITVGKEADREDVVLDAGGLKLNAMLAGGKTIPPTKLSFSVYEGKPDAAGNRPLVIPDVKPNAIVRLNAGVYHVVSNYGTINAVVRSDIRVEAGKLTEAMVEHQAASLTVKLVREAGGEALAETEWSVVNDSGDPVTETVGPYATIVLAEGSYTIIAKNRDSIYQKDITVVSGKDSEIEIVANEASRIDPDEGAE